VKQLEGNGVIYHLLSIVIDLLNKGRLSNVLGSANLGPFDVLM